MQMSLVWDSINENTNLEIYPKSNRILPTDEEGNPDYKEAQKVIDAALSTKIRPMYYFFGSVIEPYWGLDLIYDEGLRAGDIQLILPQWNQFL